MLGDLSRSDRNRMVVFTDFLIYLQQTIHTKRKIFIIIYLYTVFA